MAMVRWGFFWPRVSGMTNEEARDRRTMIFFSLGRMASETLFTAWHSIDYDITKVSYSDDVKPLYSILLELFLAKHPHYFIREP